MSPVVSWTRFWVFVSAGLVVGLMPCWGGEGGQSAPEDAPQAVVHSRAPADKASSCFCSHWRG